MPAVKKQVKKKVAPKKRVVKKRAPRKVVKKADLGGRPSGYTKKKLAEARDYLKKWKSLGDMIPSVEGLVAHIGIARSTAYKWATEEGKEEFSDILEIINETQKRELINGGLSGRLNSNITKLVLGKHGLHDKQDVNALVTEVSHEEWLNSLE